MTKHTLCFHMIARDVALGQWQPDQAITLFLFSVLYSFFTDRFTDRGLTAAGGSPASWLGWCLEVVVGGEVLKEVALLLHDAVELVAVDLAIAITVSLVDHVLELLIIDVLAQLLSNASEVAEGDLVGGVVVEQLEHLLDVLAGVLLAHLARHHLEELVELDGAVAIVVNVGDHLLELLVLDLEAESAHSSLELADIDGTRCIVVEEAECLADLLHLLVGESSPLLCLTH